MRRLLILGAGIMQGPAITIARKLGLETVVVDGNPQAPSATAADRFVVTDLKDKDALVALGRKLKEDGGLAGVMTAGTDFSTSVAFVAEKLDLPGIPYDVALNASNKGRMRACFESYGLLSPRFMVVNQWSDAAVDSYPVVVKPVDNMGGRGCRRVNSKRELRTAIEEAIHFSQSHQAIVEEYMEGPEFSVDAIVHNGSVCICGVADRHIFFEPYFVEMGHTMPTSYPADTVNTIVATFKAGIYALGIKNGAAKGDIKLTSRGVMIGEIAARLSGGFMSGWTYPYASGVEATKAAIQIAIGEEPDPCIPTKQWTSAERAVISIPGIVASYHSAVEGIEKLFTHIHVGSVVKFPTNNVSKCANVISASPHRDEALTRADQAARSVLIHLKVPCRATDSFLKSLGKPFPPDAFKVSRIMLASLKTIANPLRGTLAIVPFPLFSESGLTDYVGRTVDEVLDIIRRLTRKALPFRTDGFFGQKFWAALIRGSYQGGVYHVEYCLKLNARR
ncbi:MAG: ATP-grasp domain-containing protein [Treponema sp.]|jgi:biotin carboxylase|nr:ATP-grasp domain-containing protein [Treponema sp.]